MFKGDIHRKPCDRVPCTFHDVTMVHYVDVESLISATENPGKVEGIQAWRL